MKKFNLDTPELMGAREAADIWGKNKDYVRTSLRQSPEKWPNGSYRRFDNRQVVVTVEGMEKVTGEKDPRKKLSSKIDRSIVDIPNLFTSEFLTVHNTLADEQFKFKYDREFNALIVWDGSDSPHMSFINSTVNVNNDVLQYLEPDGLVLNIYDDEYAGHYGVNDVVKINQLLNKYGLQSPWN